jgi:hypothetical protein
VRATRWKDARAAADWDAEESDAVQDREGSGRVERVERTAVEARAGCGREARVRATRWKNAGVAAGRGT